MSGKHAPVAQRIRASDYGSEGCRFESCLAHRQARSIGSALFLYVFFLHLNARQIEEYAVIKVRDSISLSCVEDGAKNGSCFGVLASLYASATLVARIGFACRFLLF